VEEMFKKFESLLLCEGDEIITSKNRVMAVPPLHLVWRK